MGRRWRAFARMAKARLAGEDGVRSPARWQVPFGSWTRFAYPSAPSIHAGELSIDATR